ncbi:HNH endonuclease [Streptomyces flaveus]|uniref:HNH endonuclease n=1 Tax=Streptomyces flaveus TaxID=66370 RepID=UPI0035715CAD
MEADLTRPGWSQPAWAQVMARMRRKTLVVCKACHDSIHGRQLVARLASLAG